MSRSAASDAYLEAIRNGVTDAMNSFFGTITCRLFQNDYEPSAGVVLADLLEANFGGYSPAELLADEWFGDLLSEHVATSTYNFFVDFTADGLNTYTQRVYGYYLTAPGYDLLGAFRFLAPIDVAPGGTVRVQPQVSLRNLPV